MTGSFSGAVLCGGSSRRMGADKATLVVDGEAMAARVARALREAGATDLVAIGGDARELALLGLTVVPDDEPGAGPFPATLTALRYAKEDIVVVLSCDLLAPDPATIRTLVEQLGAGGPEVDAAIPVVDGVHQWTHAAWHRRSLVPLEEARRSGAASLRSGVTHLTIRAVLDLDPTHVADADDPFDLPDAR
jgi:molybdopterin-guanine dinucleotide biosynthesis protein A